MNFTKSDDRTGNGNPATAGEAHSGDDPQLARARDGQRNTPPLTLPDTERVRDVFNGTVANLRDTTELMWSGAVWDIQPPSPRELVNRAKDGPWWDHEAAMLRLLARAGATVCLVWSVPLYTLAVLGQRFGRALTALLIAGLFWHLI